jgi:hypothetical protein
MDWQIAEDNGRIYYYNAITNETSWDPPPECWEPLFTDDGIPYFHNLLTGETSWEVEGIEPGSRETVEKEEKKGDKENAENEATQQIEQDIIADETLRKLCRNYVLECRQIKLAGKASCKTRARADLLLSIGDIYTLPIEVSAQEKKASTGSNDEEIRSKLVEFFKLYDPEKSIEEINALLIEYKGKLNVLLRRLTKKYILKKKSSRDVDKKTGETDARHLMDHMTSTTSLCPDINKSGIESEKVDELEANPGKASEVILYTSSEEEYQPVEKEKEQRIEKPAEKGKEVERTQKELTTKKIMGGMVKKEVKECQNRSDSEVKEGKKATYSQKRLAVEKDDKESIQVGKQEGFNRMDESKSKHCGTKQKFATKRKNGSTEEEKVITQKREMLKIDEQFHNKKMDEMKSKNRAKSERLDQVGRQNLKILRQEKEIRALEEGIRSNSETQRTFVEKDKPGRRKQNWNVQRTLEKQARDEAVKRIQEDEIRENEKKEKLIKLKLGQDRLAKLNREKAEKEKCLDDIEYNSQEKSDLPTAFTKTEIAKRTKIEKNLTVSVSVEVGRNSEGGNLRQKERTDRMARAYRKKQQDKAMGSKKAPSEEEQQHEQDVETLRQKERTDRMARAYRKKQQKSVEEQSEDNTVNVRNGAISATQKTETLIKEQKGQTRKTSMVSAEISCPYCGLVFMDRASKQTHVEGCTYAHVECKHIGCSVRLPKHDIEKHLALCIKRDVLCFFGCGSKVRFEKSGAHYKKCPRRPMACSLGCGQTVEAQNYRNHQITECPERFQRCLICGKRVKGHIEYESHAARCKQKSSTLSSAFLDPTGVKMHSVSQGASLSQEKNECLILVEEESARLLSRKTRERVRQGNRKKRHLASIKLQKFWRRIHAKRAARVVCLQQMLGCSTTHRLHAFVQQSIDLVNVNRRRAKAFVDDTQREIALMRTVSLGKNNSDAKAVLAEIKRKIENAKHHCNHLSNEKRLLRSNIHKLRAKILQCEMKEDKAVAMTQSMKKPMQEQEEVVKELRAEAEKMERIIQVERESETVHLRMEINFLKAQLLQTSKALHGN